MKILIIGGTRFFGIPMVKKLIRDGHDITIATRGITKDDFGDRVNRIILNIYDENSVRTALNGKKFDVVVDKMAYGSKDIRNILDNLITNRFIHMSTAGVYNLDHFNIKEDEFDIKSHKLVWCSRGEVDYDFAKQQAEVVLYQKYNNIDWVTVRSPFVIGLNDYTGRLLFYVEHILREKPMWIDNMESQLCFSEATELGGFLAWLVSSDLKGPVNACSSGTISLKDIVDYIEVNTSKHAIIKADGEVAPYNSTKNNSLDTYKARGYGYTFMSIRKQIFNLLDYYIKMIEGGRY